MELTTPYEGECDTDSNFINVGSMVKFLSKEFDLKEQKDPELKIINATAFLLSNAITEIYALYTKNCNVPEEHRHLINMKNECATRYDEISMIA